MAKNILKEAIADAKAVREVALANAKAALEEAFTPKLQSMLSAKLSEDLDEEYYDEDDVDEGMYDEDDMDEGMHDVDEDDMDEGMHDVDEDDMDEGKKDKDPRKTIFNPGKPKGMKEEEVDEEIDLEELLNELELEEDEAIVDEDAEEVDESLISKPHYEAGDTILVNPSADPSNIGYVHEDENTEFDLDALLKEINSLDEEKVEEAHCYDEDGKPMPEGHCYEEDGKLKEGFTLGEEKESLNEIMDISEIIALLLPAIGVPTAMFKAAGGKERLKNVMSKASGAKEKLKAFTDFLGEMSGTTKAAGKDFGESLETELEETKEALETVKGELNEVNLLNSKLLYVNRIFKANTLDEGQKLRVVETLDKAESTKEAKLIYETIKDTFNVAKSSKVSKTKKTRSLKENFKGIASKAAGTSTAPKKEIISESNDMMKRFQKLANIQINE